MRIHFLPLTIFLVAFSTQMPIVKASNAFSQNASVFQVASNKKEKMAKATFDQIKIACSDAVEFSSYQRLRDLSDQLMHSFEETDSFALGIAKAEALMSCKDPENAQNVLKKIDPATGLEQKVWSILFWKASNASMDHANASLALRRLSAGNIQSLDQELIIVGYRADGTALTRLALDLLAEHERLNGFCEEAAMVLLAGRKGGALGARRISQASQCLQALNVEKQKDLLELAIAEANSDEAFWLVGDILRLQLMLDLASGGNDSQLIKKRLEQVAQENDDFYTQWELIRSDSARNNQGTFLPNQLPSPKVADPN